MSNAKRFSISVLAVLLLSALPALARATPGPAGSLDPSFANGGRAITAIPKFDAERVWHFALAAAPGGKIVVVGRGLVIQYRADGRLDRGFGQRGRVSIESNRGPDFEFGRVAVDSRGRILIAGTTTSPSGPGGKGQLLSSATVERLLPDGRPDPSFGTSGVLISKFGMSAPKVVNTTGEVNYGGEPEYPDASVEATGITVDGDDRPIITGNSVLEDDICRSYMGGAVSVETDEGFAARLTQGGHLDRSFGIEGVSGQGYPSKAESPQVDRFSRIEYLSPPTGRCWMRLPPFPQSLLGLDPEGKPRTGFDRATPRSTKEIVTSSVVLDGSSRALLLGETDSFDKEIVRVLPSGAPDRSFARDGTRALAPPEGLSLEGLGVDAHGRALLVGAMADPRSSRVRFWLRRMTGGGQLDRGFGKSGTTVTGFGRGTTASDVSVVVDSRGRIVVAGVGHVPRLPSQKAFLIARYRP
jgi:uncharacterized delta-60 repeat protein